MAEMRFDDDVVVITGAGRGLGREYALAFAARGAAVVVNDIGTAADGSGTVTPVAKRVVAEIKAAGGRAVADTHSITEPGGAEAVIAAGIAAFGKVTVLINNAGIISFAPLSSLTDEAWRTMQSVTLDGAFFMCRAVWPHMAAQGYGRIVNTTSNAGFGGNETLAHYGAAKLGVAGLTKCLAQEAGETGITVNAVAPMAVTRMNRDAFFGGKEAEGEDWREDIRAGRVPMGPPEAVAPTVLWLAHRSTAINGEIFSSSSGKVARVGFVVGEGWFDPHHAPEDLRDHAERIRSLGNYLDINWTGDELELIPKLFGAA
ncbi:SDR family NAD(P)-dependent oxidoreductase [Novosphingobium percolationis]|uniref:SDR family NAD(P)-dependent oxidoreductase n=1 Tax=Novosphingobium percolationis TaxID=2871811 RepID=UPI001CD68A00|nr:SDR family NAD(P)-dependent oxidoreductase [Novosphingobium percolationis]